MITEKIDRKTPITIYTTSETKEKMDEHFKECNVVKQPFLSNMVTDVVTDLEFFLYVLNYQIFKAMARPKYEDEDFEKLTGDEARRILMIKNRINCIYKDRYELKKLGLSTQELDEENEALNLEMSEIKKTAFAREKEPLTVKGLCFDVFEKK